MQKLFFALFFVSVSVFSQNHTCGFNEHMDLRYIADPGLIEIRQSYEIEIQSIINSKVFFTEKTIPVVIHIIYNDIYSNISNAQVYSAITAINEDYNANNLEFDNVISSFNSIKSDLDISFSLAQLDPSGNYTTGITRTESDFTDNANENVKSLILWDPNMYLNVWVVDNIESGAGAYAYYPGTAPSGAEGIVCRNSQFGTIGTSSSANFSSTTLTHEVGHYLNLAHTWGDSNDPGSVSNCDIDDSVSDTPNTQGTLYGCNTNQYTCGSLDNIQNYMDYTDCTNMFTEGQRSRVHASLHSSLGGRVNLWQHENLLATGVLSESQCIHDLIQVTIGTGSYATEISWIILDSLGEGVAGGGGTYSNNSSYNISVCIPPGNYSFQSIDSYGDGWNGGGYTVLECDQNVIANMANPSGSGNIEQFVVSGCTVLGCTNSEAENYNSNANESNGSCYFMGCTDSLAANFNPIATIDSGLCLYLGCMDSDAINFNGQANEDDGSCVYLDVPEIFNFTLTGSNHTIVIPNNIVVNLEQNPISIYDVLGVFYYDQNNVQRCCGYIIWDGQTNSIAAQGDDFTTEEVDGLIDGENFIFKAWEHTSNQIYDCSVTYDPEMPNHGDFVSNGISAIQSLHSYLPINSQFLAFLSGWNIFSSYLVLGDMDMSSFITPIEDFVVIVKDFEGMAYLPEWSYNGIGDLSIGQAYQIKVNQEIQMNLTGNYIYPQINPIYLDSGWNLIGYLRISPQDCVIAFESIMSELVIVKDHTGNAYLPEWNFNGIGNLFAGKGYQIKLNSPTDFYYDPN